MVDPNLPPLDDSSRLHLLTVLLYAQTALESLSLALEVLAGQLNAPGELKTLSIQADTLLDEFSKLDADLRNFLQPGGTPNVP